MATEEVLNPSCMLSNILSGLISISAHFVGLVSISALTNGPIIIDTLVKINARGTQLKRPCYFALSKIEGFKMND